MNALQRLCPGVRHVFDPRSDFPEENVTAGRWSDSSRDFKFWKEAEARILASADRTACISEEYVAHFERSTQNFPYFIAPNNVDTNLFRFNPDAREVLRREMGWSDQDFVFVYLGGMSADGWHRPDFYRQFLTHIRERIPGAKLLMLIPPHATNMVQEYFYDVGGVAIRNPAYQEVPNWLSVADIGLMFVHRRKLAVGTKLGEYLAIGLPIICNSNCLGTARFIKQCPKAGLVVDIGLGDLDDGSHPAHGQEIAELLRGRSSLTEVAAKRFSNMRVAQSYVDAYQEIGRRCGYAGR